MTTRQAHPPGTSQMPTLSQEARRTGGLCYGPNTLKPENSLPLPHPQANWDLLGKGRGERARSSQAATLSSGGSVRGSPLHVEPSPTLAFSARLLAPQGSPGPVVQLSSVSCGKLCSSQTSHLTPAAQPPQGLTRLKAGLLLPSWGLKQPACVLREGRAGVEHQRKQGRRRSSALQPWQTMWPLSLGQQDPR